MLVAEALKCQLLCRACDPSIGRRGPAGASPQLLSLLVLRLSMRNMQGSQRTQERQVARAETGEVGMISFPTIPTTTKPLVKLPRPDSNGEPAG